MMLMLLTVIVIETVNSADVGDGAAANNPDDDIETISHHLTM